MRVNTHERTPKVEPKPSIKIILIIEFGLIIALFILAAIVCSLSANSIMPAVVILVPMLVLAILFAQTQKDMEKAYIEIADDAIFVTDYYFGIKNEKKFSVRQIGTAEILLGSSMRVRGYRYSSAGCAYIVFRDACDRYMFKVICIPETKQLFSKYLK